MRGGQNSGSHVDAALVWAEALEKAAVLGHSPLGDIHLRQHFVPTGDRVMERFGQLAHRFENAVDSDLNENDVLFRIDVNVGRSAVEGDLHELVAESDDIGFLMLKFARLAAP